MQSPLVIDVDSSQALLRRCGCGSVGWRHCWYHGLRAHPPAADHKVIHCTPLRR